MISDFFKALGQIGDPRFRKVLFLGVGLTIGLLFILTALLVTVVGWFAPDVVTLPVIGWEMTWIDNALSWAIVPLMIVLSIFLMVPVASAFTSIFLDEVADAVRAPAPPHIALLQVVAAAFLNIGTFDTTERTLTVFIQPAGWAFSIWGLIYVFSLVYAVYQLAPKHESTTLAATRIPALVGFLGSIAWLYFAGSGDWQTWFTAPVLFLMAIAFTYVVRTPAAADATRAIFAKKLLYPYAAWTGIAAWLNIVVLLTDKGVVTSETTNQVVNALLFGCIAVFTFWQLRRTEYSVFYAGVLVWAGIGIGAANLDDGTWWFAGLGGLLALAALWLTITARRSTDRPAHAIE